MTVSITGKTHDNTTVRLKLYIIAKRSIDIGQLEYRGSEISTL